MTTRCDCPPKIELPTKEVRQRDIGQTKIPEGEIGEPTAGREERAQPPQQSSHDDEKEQTSHTILQSNTETNHSSSRESADSSSHVSAPA